MVFSSVVFLAYFLPLFLAGYHLLPRPARNPFLLGASALFYAWGAPRFLFVVLGATFLDFHFVRFMDAARSPGRRRAFLLLSLGLNLGLLAWFKYANFLVDNVNAALAAAGLEPWAWARVALPIGISFYTVETVTYVVDVYRGEHAALRRFWHYQLYILFFPKLVAGPIVRYCQIADQLEDRRDHETSAAFLLGFERFVLGLCRKVLLGDPLAHWAERAFALGPGAVGTGTAWLALSAYLLHVYYDFSGYSDMAVGLGRMVGFRLPENFDNPFASRSVNEFWRRWHMTLSSWMRNYLYLPLGGNRVPRARQLVNLGLVFLLSGLWHGAGWGYVLFGAWHGAFMILERLDPLGLEARLPAALGRLRTWLVFALSMAFFRDMPLADVGRLALALSGQGGRAAQPLDAEFVTVLALGLLFAFWAVLPGGQASQARVFAGERGAAGHVAATLAALAGYVVGLSQAAWSPFSPFVYFRF